MICHSQHTIEISTEERGPQVEALIASCRKDRTIQDLGDGRLSIACPSATDLRRLFRALELRLQVDQPDAVAVDDDVSAGDYPSATQLDQISTWAPASPWQGSAPWLPVLDLVLAAWNTDLGSATRREGSIVTLVTGGWSGNEDILAALADNTTAWSLLWLSSRRGGWHEFGVPA